MIFRAGASYRRYYSNLFSTVRQFHFASLEDFVLSSTNFSGFENALCTRAPSRLFFVVPKSRAKQDLSRALFIFTKIFFVKPKMSKRNNGDFKVHADLPAATAAYFTSLLLYLKKILRSKFVRLSINSPGVEIVLREPLTFFPLVHPSFDYHDWQYPFRFQLAFSSSFLGRTSITRFYINFLSLFFHPYEINLSLSLFFYKN
jgi:hypothetical protein